MMIDREIVDLQYEAMQCMKTEPILTKPDIYKSDIHNGATLLPKSPEGFKFEP